VFIIAVPMALTIILIPCLIPFICLLIPFSWAVSVFLEQANIAIVVENLGILDGLKRAWDVVKVNIGNYIVMALILGLGVNLVGGLIIGLPLVFVIGPAISGAIIGTNTSLNTGLLVSGLCLIFYIPVAIFLNGLLQGYIKSAWTLTYLRLTGKRLPVVPTVAPEAGA
ncbi:MAG: hypothetical protein ACM3PY_08825, partial [Omnitrophica WOR_2 bacterium]